MDTDTVLVYSKTNRGFATTEGEFRSIRRYGQSLVDMVSAGISQLLSVNAFWTTAVPLSASPPVSRAYFHVQKNKGDF